MHPIFFAWLGDYESLIATGFHAFGRSRVVAILHGAAYIGVIEAPTAKVRPMIAKLSPKLCVLPGPHGTLAPEHVAAIALVAPRATIKQGDPMKAVLSYVHSLFGDGEFDPDAY